MTGRLYYDDPYLTQFTAEVVEASPDGRRVYLNRTAFYPASGGQPADLGVLGGVALLDVVDEDDRVAHVMAEPLHATSVEGTVNWVRRHDHMQQHSGQHLLSAVLEELYGIGTVSFHLGAESSTIDVSAASLTAAQVVEAERRVNEIVWENRSIVVSYEDAREAQGLRKPSDRDGVLRIVSIAGLDRSACGGTHVRSTSGIGLVQIRKLDKIRGTTRVEFLCGARALDRARTDYERLSEVARAFSAPLDQAPQLVATLLDRLTEAEKDKKRMGLELAKFSGRQLYESAQPSADGVRRFRLVRPQGAIEEAQRIAAQSFTSTEKAVYFEAAGFSFLLAASKDSGVNAGEILKKALTAVGGRGGGNPQVAQGSVPSEEALRRLLTLLEPVTG